MIFFQIFTYLVFIHVKYMHLSQRDACLWSALHEGIKNASSSHSLVPGRVVVHGGGRQGGHPPGLTLADCIGMYTLTRYFGNIQERILATLFAFVMPCTLMSLYVQAHMEAGDRAGAIQACLRHGNASTGGDARLWEETLRWLGSLDQDCSDEVSFADVCSLTLAGANFGSAGFS